MEQSNMTALVSAFARAYHSKNNEIKVFDDSLAAKILTEKEYWQISSSMVQGIHYFNPDFIGSYKEALRWIVDNQLSPSPLGRAAYTEKMLENAVKIGAKQYLIFAAGFDTFAYRQPIYANKLEIFEIDRPLASVEKQKRAKLINNKAIVNLNYIQADFSIPDWQDNLLLCPTFDRSAISFCSLLGVSYYLSRNNFRNTILSISNLVPNGSSIVFDYPDQNTFTEYASERVRKQLAMTRTVNEAMCASYSYMEMEQILAEYGFLIYEHLEPQEITEQYFKEYNLANPKYPIIAFENVNYCLGTKK
jgi:methyltransferase (TIGR00027 family)